MASVGPHSSISERRSHDVLPPLRLGVDDWCPRKLHHARQNRAGVEEGLRELPRGAAVPLIVAVDRLESLGRLIQGREAEHSLPVWKERARSGVLHHHRLTGGEITEAAIAHPRVAE